MHLAEADAAHAALLARVPDARARLGAAVLELRQAMTGLEALARLTGRSDGQPLGVFVPPVAGGPELTFVITPVDLLAAMHRIGDLDAPPARNATILAFPNR